MRAAVLRRDKFIASFALTRRVDNPRLRVEVYNERWIAHRFDVRVPGDLDIPEFSDRLCEAYRDQGMQGAPMRRRRGQRPTID